jgi:hypothetical protein
MHLGGPLNHYFETFRSPLCDGRTLEFDSEGNAWNLEYIAVPRIEPAKPDMHPNSKQVVWEGLPQELWSNLGPNTDKLTPKPCTMTQYKARQTNKIAFFPLPWAPTVFDTEFRRAQIKLRMLRWTR